MSYVIKDITDQRIIEKTEHRGYMALETYVDGDYLTIFVEVRAKLGSAHEYFRARADTNSVLRFFQSKNALWTKADVLTQILENKI